MRAATERLEYWQRRHLAVSLGELIAADPVAATMRIDGITATSDSFELDRVWEGRPGEDGSRARSLNSYREAHLAELESETSLMLFALRDDLDDEFEPVGEKLVYLPLSGWALAFDGGDAEGQGDLA